MTPDEQPGWLDEVTEQWVTDTPCFEALLMERMREAMDGWGRDG